MRRTGISPLEIIALIIFIGLTGLLVWWQVLMSDARARDSVRKTDINAIYYNLQEVYYPLHKSYPQVLHTADLKGADPAIFKDPDGHLITDPLSNYHYQPRGCDGQICTGFSLVARLEQEADFMKSTADN